MATLGARPLRPGWPASRFPLSFHPRVVPAETPRTLKGVSSQTNPARNPELDPMTEGSTSHLPTVESVRNNLAAALQEMHRLHDAHGKVLLGLDAMFNNMEACNTLLKQQHEQQLAKAVEGRQIATIWACSLWQQLQTMRQLLADQAAQRSGATAAAAAGTESQGSTAAKSSEDHMSAHEDILLVSKVAASWTNGEHVTEAVHGQGLEVAVEQIGAPAAGAAALQVPDPQDLSSSTHMIRVDQAIATVSPLQHDPRASSPSPRAASHSPEAPSGLSLTLNTKAAEESVPTLILTRATESAPEHDSRAATEAAAHSVILQPSDSTKAAKHAQPAQLSSPTDPTSASAGKGSAQQLSEPANVAAATSTIPDGGKDTAEPCVASACKKKNKSARKTAQMAAAKLTAAQQPNKIVEPTNGSKDSSQQLLKSGQGAADKAATVSTVKPDQGRSVAEPPAVAVSRKQSKRACKTASLTAAQPTSGQLVSKVVQGTNGSNDSNQQVPESDMAAAAKGTAVNAAGIDKGRPVAEPPAAAVNKKRSKGARKAAQMTAANHSSTTQSGKNVAATAVSKKSTQQLPEVGEEAGIETAATYIHTDPAVSNKSTNESAQSPAGKSGNQPSLVLQPSVAKSGKSSVPLVSKSDEAAAVSNKIAAEPTSAPPPPGTVKLAATTDSPAADPTVAGSAAAAVTPQQEATVPKAKMGAKQSRRAQQAQPAVLQSKSAAPVADASTVAATGMPAAPAKVPATPLVEPQASAKKGSKLAVSPVHIPAADSIAVVQASFGRSIVLSVASAAESALGSSAAHAGDSVSKQPVTGAAAKAKQFVTDEAAAQLPSHAKTPAAAATATGVATQTPAAHLPPSAASTHAVAAAVDTYADISARQTSRLVCTTIDCTTPALADKPCAVSIRVINPQQAPKAHKTSLVAKQRRKVQAQQATDVATCDQTLSQPAEKAPTAATSQMVIAPAFVAPTASEAKVPGNVTADSLTEVPTANVISLMLSSAVDTPAPFATATHPSPQGPTYNVAAAGQAADASLIEHAATLAVAAESPTTADVTLLKAARAEHAAGNAGAEQAAGNSDAELASANATAAEVTLAHALSQQHAADKLVIIHATDNAADVAGAEHTVGKLGFAHVAVPPAGPLTAPHPATAAGPMTAPEEAAAATTANAKHVTAKLAASEQVTSRLVAARHSPPRAASADHATAILRDGPATAKHLAPNAIAAETASAKLHKDSSVAQCASSALPDHAASTSGRCPPQSAVGKISIQQYSQAGMTAFHTSSTDSAALTSQETLASRRRQIERKVCAYKRGLSNVEDSHPGIRALHKITSHSIVGVSQEVQLCAQRQQALRAFLEKAQVD